MRTYTPSERRVLLLQRAAVLLFGPAGSVAYLHTYAAELGTTPAGAAWIGGAVALAAGERLRAVASGAGHLAMDRIFRTGEASAGPADPLDPGLRPRLASPSSRQDQ